MQPPVITPPTISDFFSALFDDLRGQNLLIWTLPDKRSSWFPSRAGAEAHVNGVAKTHDVYFGAGLSARDMGPGRRCKAADISGIGALWADLDIACPGSHTKKRLPPTREAALSILKELPEPSIIVNSGHGLQCYWLLQEPWIFTDAADHDRAAQLSSQWATTLRTMAERQGWEVDSVGDLSRVLRVPWTMNRKTDPVLVEILRFDDVRYSPHDFEQYFQQEAPRLSPDFKPAELSKPKATTSNTPAQAVGCNGLKVEAGATPPFDKFHALMENDTKFKASWHRKRTDLNDTSTSGYDMSLAAIACRVGWTDQEVCNLLLAARRFHEDEDMHLRDDYYRRTVTKARAGVESIHDASVLDDIDAGPGDAASKRVAKLEYLRELFKLPLTRVIRYVSVDPVFHLEVDGHGVIQLGTVENLMEQGFFRRKVGAMTLTALPRFKGTVWNRIVQAMFDVCETERATHDSTLEGQARLWVDSYLDEKTPLPESAMAEALAERHPFTRGGWVWLFGDQLRRHVWTAFGEKVTPRTMGVTLRSSGYEAEKINVSNNGCASSRSVWRVRKAEVDLGHHTE